MDSKQNNTKKSIPLSDSLPYHAQRLSHELVESKFADAGYKLISRYERNTQKLDFVCPQGHKHSMSWMSFQAGGRCAHCIGRVVTQEQVEARFTERGYKLLSQYQSRNEKLEFICPQGHRHHTKWANFQRGRGCAICAGTLPIKHTQIQLAFSSEGYQLLSSSASRAKKLEFVCPKGHRHSMSWDSFRQGCRCAVCAGKIVTHEQVKAAFESEGYTLLSEYKRSDKKLDFLCPEGHKHSMSWDSFKQGARCTYCTKHGYKDNHPQRLTQDFVESAFAAKGYQLISKYENSGKKLDFLCPEGHKHSMSWDSFKQGARCAVCAGKIVTHQQVELAFKAEGYQLLSKYENANKKLTFVCPEGHRHSITWGHFMSGKRCAYCAGHVVLHEDVKLAFEAEGYILLSIYKNSKQKLNFICPEGHRHGIVWGAFKQGVRCSYCSNGGYNVESPGRLYYLRFDTQIGPLWKIGITNRTIKERFQSEKTPYTILLDEWHEDGSISPLKEKQILKRHKKHLYKGEPILVSGNTECFTKDVLKLDKPIAQLPLPFSIAV